MSTIEEIKQLLVFLKNDGRNMTVFIGPRLTLREWLRYKAAELLDRLEEEDGNSEMDICVIKGKEFTFGQLKRWINKYNLLNRSLIKIGGPKDDIIDEVRAKCKTSYEKTTEIVNTILRHQASILDRTVDIFNL